MAGPFETQIGIGLKDNFSEKYRQLRADIKRDDEEAQRSRERLGIQSRQQINQNIQELRRAYQQLASSSVVGANEQVRAYEKVTREIAKLDAELGKMDRTQSRLATGMQRLKSLGGIAAGLTGAAMVLTKPIQQQRDFDTRLHSASNFLYRDSNDAGTRLAGVQTIRDNVNKATEYGGGTREAALDAAEVLARSKMGRGDVFSALPEVMKVSTATGADASDVASLMTSTFNFGFKGKEANAALDAATTASQHGKADVALLAREAPRGLENARGAGFMGAKGYADIMALYEVASSIAGSPEEGATNTNDLLTELSSTNLANNASRVKIHGKKLDFKSMATHDAQQGHNSLYTLQHVIGAVDANDAKMKRLRSQLGSTTDPEKRTNIQRAIDEKHRQNVGLFLHNQQSANAYLGYERNSEQFEAISKDVQAQFDKPEGQRSTDVDYAVMKDTASYKDQRLDTQKEKASDAVTKPLSDALGTLEGKVADLAIEFPKVATAAEGAAIALSAVAAFGAIKGGVGILTRLRKGDGSLGKVAGEVVEGAENVVSDVGGKSGWLSKNLPRLGKVAGEAGADAVKVLSPLLKILNPVGDMMMGADVLYSQSMERGIDRVKGTRVTASLPMPVGGLDALDEIRRWLAHSDNTHPANKSNPGQAGTNTPALPPINIYLDNTLMTQHVMQQAEFNARRHGA